MGQQSSVRSVLFVFQFLFFFLFLLLAMWNWQHFNIFQSHPSLYLQTPPRNPDLVYLSFLKSICFLASYCVLSKPLLSYPSIHLHPCVLHFRGLFGLTWRCHSLARCDETPKPQMVLMDVHQPNGKWRFIDVYESFLCLSES